MEITETQYREYEQLKTKFYKDLELESILKRNLEEDIDEPIRKCVAAMALLGLQPLWSCCGFDYYNQPTHKWHQYGRIFFILNLTPEFSRHMIQFPERDSWTYRMLSKEETDFHYNFINPIPQWDSPSCPYYYEPAVVAIAKLEAYLLGLKSEFHDEVTLVDTSGIWNKSFPQWQYPARKSWVIRKEYLL